MFEKAKKFYNEHEEEVLIVSAAVVGVIGLALIAENLKSFKVKLNEAEYLPNNTKWANETRKTLEGFGAVYKDGYDIPFATKEVAMKFMEERGTTYQLEIIDDLTSTIWISK